MNEIDFVLETIDRGGGEIQKVIMPTMDGNPMPAALTVEEDVETTDFLPVIFKDTKERQSKLMFINLVDLKDIAKYKEQLAKKGTEEDDHQQIGQINEDEIMLSLEQARHNLHKIGTPEAKLKGKFLKMLKREYRDNGQKIQKVALSHYDKIVSMIPDTSGIDYMKFKPKNVPKGNIIDAWASEEELAGEDVEPVLEVVYVIVDSESDSNLQSNKQKAAADGDNDIDILLSGFTRAGIELIDKVAIQVVVNDTEFTEIKIAETEELAEYKNSADTDQFIRVIFTDNNSQMCSQPVPVLLLHKLDKTNTLDSIDESTTQLSRENAVELNAFGEFNDEEPAPIMLNKYSKVEGVTVISNLDLAQKVVTDQQIIELGEDNSVLMISVSNPHRELLKKHILLF